MSAALIMEPHQQQEQEGEGSAHARRAQNILKQKVVSDKLKEQVETGFTEQVFLPEESSWRVQSVTPDSGVTSSPHTSHIKHCFLDYHSFYLQRYFVTRGRSQTTRS